MSSLKKSTSLLIGFWLAEWFRPCRTICPRRDRRGRSHLHPQLQPIHREAWYSHPWGFHLLLKWKKYELCIYWKVLLIRNVGRYMCLISAAMMRWVELVVYYYRFSATRYMKVKKMGITEILRRIWLFSSNKIKSSASVSKQPTQLIVKLGTMRTSVRIFYFSLWHVKFEIMRGFNSFWEWLFLTFRLVMV